MFSLNDDYKESYQDLKFSVCHYLYTLNKQLQYEGSTLQK